MGSRTKMSRRGFLQGAGAGAALLLLGSSRAAFGRQPSARDTGWAGAVGGLAPAWKSANRSQAEVFTPDAEIRITATKKLVQILPGAATRVWSYEGELLQGSGVTVQSIPGSYLGPILRVQSGKKLRILFQNNLDEESVLHPHGLRVPEDCDGQPMQAIGPGQTKVYEFQVIDRAGAYWFHPHPMGRTAEQVAMGLAGLFSVWDGEEELAVPGASTGANDIPLILQDRNFDAYNQILYNPNMMWGYLGSRILVNGKPDTVLSLEPRAYRLRLLNGSNARTYKLAWSNGMPLRVIGTDGGLLPAVESRAYVMLMPGERVDLWADFATLAGRQVTLRSLAFSAGGMGMGGMGGMGMGEMGGIGTSGMEMDGMGVGGMGMGGMGGMGSSLANGAAFDILKVTVGKKAGTRPQLGPLPALGERFDAGNVPNYASPVPFVLAMQQMMTWTINGRVYDPMAVADDEMVIRDEPIAWEWVNASSIPHPMHIHNVQFQVVKRTPPSSSSSYGTINRGLVDSGWKDTVLVWPGERVKIAMKFGPHTGMYMYHCHILEHEDMTMMRNLMVMEPMSDPMPGM